MGKKILPIKILVLGILSPNFRAGFGTPSMEHCSAAVSPFPHPWVCKNAERLDPTKPGDGSEEYDEGDRLPQVRLT